MDSGKRRLRYLYAERHLLFLIVRAAPIPPKRRSDCWRIQTAVLLLLLGISLGCAHKKLNQPSITEIGITLHGCLERAGEGYVVIQNRTRSRFPLAGVSNKVSRLVGHQVEVTGKITPTYSLQIENVRTDVISISNHCDTGD